MLHHKCNWVTMLYSRKKNCIGETTIKKKIKKGYNELLCRTETDSQTLKNLVTRGDMFGGEG